MADYLQGIFQVVRARWKSITVTGLFAISAAIALIDPATRLLTGGKGFAGRSLPVQVSLFLALFGILLLILYISWFLIHAFFLRYQRWERLTRWISRFLDALSRSGILSQIGFGILLAGMVVLTIINLRIVFFPYQMEFREGAIVLTNDAFLKGINPWSLENNLQYINVYGIVYNALILPFTWILGNHIWIYRLVSMLAIIGQIVLVSAVLRHKRVEWFYTGAAVIFIWLGQIYYTTPMARPDTLGQLFFLLTLFLPILKNYSTKSLLWSGVFAILGFYTKPYFVLGLPFLAVYLFLFRSKLKAIIYAAGTGITLILFALLINQIFEAYFLNVVFSHIADTNRIFEYMIGQSIRFGRDYWAVLFFGLLATILAIRNFICAPGLTTRLQFSIKSSLLTTQMDENLFYLVIAALLIFFSLGRHNGTKMAYYYQLISPFLLILVFSFLQNRPILSGLAVIFLSINLITHGMENLKPDLQAYPVAEWQQIDSLLEHKTKVANSPAITYAMMQHGIPVVNSGQTSYYYPYPDQPFFLYPDLEKIRSIGDQFFLDVKENLSRQEYDLIIVDTPYPAFAKRSAYQETYEPGEVITIRMPHTMQTWDVVVMSPKSE